FFLCAGGVAMYLTSRMNTEFWRSKWVYLYGLAVFLLSVTLVAGTTHGGGRRWLFLGPIGFQPSEFAKFVWIVAVARYLDRYHSRLRTVKWALFYPLAIFLPLAALIAAEPDFGNPFVGFLVFFCLLLVSGIEWRYILVYPLVAIPAFGGLILAKPYRMARMLSFFNLWRGVSEDQLARNGAPYQVAQALVALGSGGFFGKGLGESDLKLHYLPQPHTDFIFPVIGEELGFAGSALVIVLYSLVAICGMRVAYKTERLFNKFLAFGITLNIVLQAAIHMAVTTALAPTKGITLPFLSYGGSSLVISCMMAGVLLRLSRLQESR
ncbi:MAG: putative peptidoglycan glycosyltransferase FtsW, partial [Elusimicrobiota bacterium]